MSDFNTLREECCEVNKALGESGLVDLTFGNASICDRTQGVFAIKPSGVDYHRLTPSDMVILDMEGNIVEGNLRASSDTPTHRRLFLGFPEIRSIVHTHSRFAVSFAQAGIPVPILGTTHADYFFGDVPVTRPMTRDEIESHYEWETGTVILEAFADKNPLHMPAVLVRNHGPFTWGESGAKALENAVALEIICQMAWQARLLNPACASPSPSLIEKHFFRKHGPGAYYGQPGHKG